MVAKGHDFPDVTLGVVVDADSTLRFPDFRAEERTFALIAQLAGRAGRGPRGGRVLVQTTAPDAPAIAAAARHDTRGVRRRRARAPARARLPAVRGPDPDRLLVRGGGAAARGGGRDRRGGGAGPRRDRARPGAAVPPARPPPLPGRGQGPRPRRGDRGGARGGRPRGERPRAPRGRVLRRRRPAVTTSVDLDARPSREPIEDASDLRRAGRRRSVDAACAPISGTRMATDAHASRAPRRSVPSSMPQFASPSPGSTAQPLVRPSSVARVIASEPKRSRTPSTAASSEPPSASSGQRELVGVVRETRRRSRRRASARRARSAAPPRPAAPAPPPGSVAVEARRLGQRARPRDRASRSRRTAAAARPCGRSARTPASAA